MNGSTSNRRARHSSLCPSRISRPRSRTCPSSPGCICIANAAGETIYIGKARSLRDRVRSYLGARGVHPKTDALLDEADRLEVIVTDSVVEALALENHLVKERVAAVQRPAARRQELSVPAADDQRGVSARARRPPRGARRHVLRRARSCRRRWRGGRWG